MLLEVLGGAGLASGALAWGVRGKTSPVFGPTIWRGPVSPRALALTFDDGPSESTLRVLDLLDQQAVSATFFMCGHHVRRLPAVARRVVEYGHEVGNHSDVHPYFMFRSPSAILGQLERAQQAIAETTGITPAFFRPPYGVRWFGLRAALARLNLRSVMWTEIALDWKRSGPAVVERLMPKLRPGAILCFHDGRELRHSPDITSTLEALSVLIPRARTDGYEFRTLSRLLKGQ